ncbi:MAG: nucleotide exchange factor GrpE [Christensenellaceae bacterium]
MRFLKRRETETESAQGDEGAIERAKRQSKEARRSLQEMKGEMEAIRQEIDGIERRLRCFTADLQAHEERMDEGERLIFCGEYIALYSLLMDGVDAHRDKAANKGDQDYADLVEFLSSAAEYLAECLVRYGVEEIRSEKGTPFDGRIHLSTSEDFSPRRSVVGESVRSGFRLEGQILLKERVNVETKNDRSQNDRSKTEEEA